MGLTVLRSSLLMSVERQLTGRQRTEKQQRFNRCESSADENKRTLYNATIRGTSHVLEVVKGPSVTCNKSEAVFRFIRAVHDRLRPILYRMYILFERHQVFWVQHETITCKIGPVLNNA